MEGRGPERCLALDAIQAGCLVTVQPRRLFDSRPRFVVTALSELSDPPQSTS